MDKNDFNILSLCFKLALVGVAIVFFKWILIIAVVGGLLYWIFKK